MRLLLVCGMLGAGEFCASLAPHFAEAWPVAAIAAALVALVGYGWSVRGWTYGFVFVLGVMLFLLASTSEERRYRDQPWMRGRQRRQFERVERTGVRFELRQALSRRLTLGLDEREPAVALSRAILLGERRRMPRRQKRLFVESGTIHVFAISGLHVMAVANVLMAVLACFFLPRRAIGLLAVPILWGYVHLVGSPPSAVRAALTATFHCLAPLAWRRPDGMRAWALTFLSVHLCRPLQIVDVGSALSFAVMFVIVLTGDLTRNLGRVKRTLAVTAAAWAAGVPIGAHVFGRVTPAGLLANLVLIGAAKLTVYAGAMGLMASAVSTTLSVHFNNLCALGVRAMTFVAESVSRLPGANIETGPWTLTACAGWYAGLAVLAGVVVSRTHRRRLV